MSEFIEGIKRLFESHVLSLQKLKDLKATEKITKEEYNYIIGKG